MCTRFYVEPETEELEEIIETAKRSGLARVFLKDGKPVLTSGEVRPTDVVPVTEVFVRMAVESPEREIFVSSELKSSISRVRYTSRNS